jgi:hypothetical protein
VSSDIPILGFDSSDGDGKPPTTVLREADPEAIRRDWPADDSERLLERRLSDGSLGISVDVHPERGYLVDAPNHGRFHVEADGSAVECAPVEGPAWIWHRALFAQALPIAAALNGLEPLHASGVLVDGKAIAFAGHSGAGKTSLAIHLVDQGAPLVADDVVTLSVADDAVQANPGVRFANIAEEQIDDIPEERRAAIGRVIGKSEKLHLLIERACEAPAPLAGVYFVERGPSVERLEFQRQWPPDPRSLLSATFLPHIQAPARMANQIDVYARLATDVMTYQLRVPASLSAAELAPLVLDHARGLEPSPA